MKPPTFLRVSFVPAPWTGIGIMSRVIDGCNVGGANTSF
jgi:hypothetical protein